MISIRCNVDINGKIRRISIGSGIDTNNTNTYTIYKDGVPVMEATGPRCGWNPFDTAYIFQNHLCIGSGETVYFLSIETGELRKQVFQCISDASMKIETDYM